jgi:hypothetical protein
MDEEQDPNAILASPNHPIWKIMTALVAILAAAWGLNGGVTP